MDCLPLFVSWKGLCPLISLSSCPAGETSSIMPRCHWQRVKRPWPGCPAAPAAEPTPAQPSSRQPRRSRRARGGCSTHPALAAPLPPGQGGGGAAHPRTPRTPRTPGPPRRAGGRLPAQSRPHPHPHPRAQARRGCGRRVSSPGFLPSPLATRDPSERRAPPGPGPGPALCARHPPPPGAGAAAVAVPGVAVPGVAVPAVTELPRTMPLRGLLPLCLLCLQAALPLRGHRGRYAG